MQSWRRFPFVGEVTAEQVLLYANRGFAGTGEYRQYEHIVTMQANMRTLMRTLDGIAEVEEREQFRRELGGQLLGEMVAAHHSARPPRTLTIDDARRALAGHITVYTGDALDERNVIEAQLRDVEAHLAVEAAQSERLEAALALLDEGHRDYANTVAQGDGPLSPWEPRPGASALNSNPERNPS